MPALPAVLARQRIVKAIQAVRERFEPMHGNCALPPPLNHWVASRRYAPTLASHPKAALSSWGLPSPVVFAALPFWATHKCSLPIANTTRREKCRASVRDVRAYPKPRRAHSRHSSRDKIRAIGAQPSAPVRSLTSTSNPVPVTRSARHVPC